MGAIIWTISLNNVSRGGGVAKGEPNLGGAGNPKWQRLVHTQDYCRRSVDLFFFLILIIENLKKYHQCINSNHAMVHLGSTIATIIHELQEWWTLGCPGAFVSEEWGLQLFLKRGNGNGGTQLSHGCQGLRSFSSHQSPSLACLPREHTGDLWAHTLVAHEWALIKAQGFKSSRFPTGNLSNHSSFIQRILSSLRKQGWLFYLGAI